MTHPAYTLTEEAYVAGIPDNCDAKTWDRHVHEIGICWGLAHDIEQGNNTRDPKKCGMCDYNNNVTDEERSNYWRGVHTWNILSEE